MSGVNKWGLSDDSSSSVSAEDLATKVSKTGDTMRGDLDMGGHFIRNLHPPMANTDGATKLYVDAISSRSVVKTGDTMSGDLLLSGGTDTYRNLGCAGLNEGKTFQVILGDDNFFSYTKPPAGITNPVILNCNGFLIKFRDNNIMRIATSGSDMEIITYTRLKLNAEINCSGYNIYSLADPIGDSDAATKRYVDKKKNVIGYVPNLDSSNSKLGFSVSASSTFIHNRPNAFSPHHVFNTSDSVEWCTLGITTNFWIKIECPESIIVWKFTLRGRPSGIERIYNWRLEGSNDNSAWTTIYSNNNYLVTNVLHSFDISSNTTPYKYYRIFVLNAEPFNPGLRHWQLYTYLI